MPAAISVGSNLTFDGADWRVESNVLDRNDLELYGARIDADFVEGSCGQVRSEGVEGLIAQMSQDIESCCHIPTRRS